MNRLTYVLLVLAIPSVLAPLHAAAQTRGPWIEPRLSLVVSAGDLGRTDIISGSGYGAFTGVGGAVAAGLGVGVPLSDAWSVRVTADHAFDAEVKGEWKCVPFVACPSVLLPLAGELVRSTVVAETRYRLTTGQFVDPVAFAGIGLQKVSVEWPAPPADITLPATEYEDTEPVYRLGVGIERLVGAAAYGVEVAANGSRFGGGAYRSIEGSVPEDRPFRVGVVLTGSVRIEL